MTGRPGDMGRSALVRAGGVDIILTEMRITPMDRGYLSLLDVDARTYSIHVVKGALAWKTGFGDLVDSDIFVDAPGVTPVRLESLSYALLRRPIYPLDSLDGR